MRAVELGNIAGTIPKSLQIQWRALVFQPALPEDLSLRMTNRRVLRCLVPLFVLAFATAPGRADELRQWKDKTGQFSVTATLLEATPTSVTLLRADNGKTLVVPLDKLSSADQEYVQQLAEKANSGPIELGITSEWQFSVPEMDIATPTAEAIVKLPKPQSFFETFNVVAINARRKLGVIHSVYTETRRGPPFTRIQMLDYSAAVVTKEFSIDGQWDVLAMNDVATKLLLRRIEGEDELCIATIENDRVELGESWRPYKELVNLTDENLLARYEAMLPTLSEAEQKRYELSKKRDDSSAVDGILKSLRKSPGSNVSYAVIAANDTIVTVNPWGTIRVWSADTRTVVREYQFVKGCSALLSPDGEHLAVGGSGLIGIINVHTHRFAVKSLPSLHSGCNLAFSPSGKRLAYSPIAELRIVDVESGQVIHQGSLHSAGSNRAVAMPNEEHVLVDRNYLYDFSSGTFMWVYRDAMHVQAGRHAIWLKKNTRGRESVVINSIPHQEVKEKVESFVGSGEFEILKPGFKVALDTSEVTPSYRQQVERDMRGVIDRRGGSIDPASTTVFKCYVNPPKIQRLSYMLTGTHDVPVIHAGVKIVVDGIQRWNFGWDNTPSSVPLESHAATTRHLENVLKRPNLGYFSNDKLLPENLTRSPSGVRVSDGYEAFGSSVLTPTGWGVED